MKSIKVGVCGVGNVGGAVLENLSNSPEIVENNGGVKIDVIQVGARKGKSAVSFDLNVTNYKEIKDKIEKLNVGEALKSKSKKIEIPVCCDPSFSLDMERLEKKLNLNLIA